MGLKSNKQLLFQILEFKETIEEIGEIEILKLWIKIITLIILNVF